MGNGFTILAKLDAGNGFIQVKQCWGSYAPDFERTIEIADGSTSLFVTPAQLAELIAQVQSTQRHIAEALSESMNDATARG